MNRTLVHLVAAVVLILALGTRCVASCFIQSSQSSAHACCHKNKAKHQSSQSENCEGSSFEVQKPASTAVPVDIAGQIAAPALNLAFGDTQRFTSTVPQLYVVPLHEVLRV